MIRYAACLLAFLLAGVAHAETLRVMTTGLGLGTVSGDASSGINCTQAGGVVLCEASLLTGTSVLLRATAGSGSTFVSWGGDCPDSDPVTPANECRVSVTTYRSVRARFDPSAAIVPLTEAEIGTFGAGTSGIGSYLAAHPHINSPGRFIAALPAEYKVNWLLMPRSESLQTGTAQYPRILLTNAEATRAFSIGLKEHLSYPASHPNSVEFMQWDDAQKTFRFHEIKLTAIPGMDDIDPDPTVFEPRFPARPRGVEIDDARCFACHSTGNVLNRGTTPGTDGVSRDIPFKLKPNWDAYDSWGGQLPFNRDRIYKGSVEAAAFRRFFNLWNWREDHRIRGVVEQLTFQPAGVPDGTAALTRRHASDTGVLTDVLADDRITRLEAGGPNDGRIVFGFDPAGTPVTTEPQPTGTGVSIDYEFNRRQGGAGTSVLRNDTFIAPSDFVTLHSTLSVRSDAGRAVRFLDTLSANVNTLRVVDEVKTHRYATGGVPVDVRALTVAIASGCYSPVGGPDIAAAQTISPALPAAAAAFFDQRNGLDFNGVYDDTKRRQRSLPLRKADIQKLTLSRTGDTYVFDEDGPVMGPPAPEVVNGLIQQYGGSTLGVPGGSGGVDTSLLRLRQEVFRRPVDRGGPDQTVMGGVLVDRESYVSLAGMDLTGVQALFRYFLEPLGVSVDKWNTDVRGRSRTYAFSVQFVVYVDVLASPDPGSLRESLGIPASTTDVCPVVMPMVNTMFASLPAVDAVPTYTDIQRIFNRSCIECHGGLGYPPYRNYGGIAVPLDLSENESPLAGERRLQRSHAAALARVTSDPATSWLYQRITDYGQLAHPYNPGQPYNPADPDDAMMPDVADERCPDGMMPCGGPPLNKTDIETIRRWIVGGSPYTEGDPHIRTVNGVNYDFQSSGEFTLLRDEGLEIQVRQTPAPTAAPLSNDYTGLSACVSVNTAVALRVGSHRVTYQPDLARGAKGRLVLRVDGKEVPLEPHVLGAGRVSPTSVPGGMRVQYPGGTSVVVTPGEWIGISFLNVTVSNARAVDGVMGAVDKGQWLPALPDRSQLGPRPSDMAQRHALLYKTFADAWRVSAATSLFDYEEGLGPQSFVAPRWPELSPQVCSAPALPGAPVGVPPAAPLPIAQAEKLCAGVADAGRRKNCVADVVATGAPVFAKTYLLTEKIAERKPPRAPVLRTPSMNAVLEGGSVSFSWAQAPAADSQPLYVLHCVWSSERSYNANKDCSLVKKQWFPSFEDWLDFAIVALIALLIFVVLLVATGTRLLLLLLLSLGVAAWSGYQIWNIQRNGVTWTANVATLERGKIYFWKAVAEDDEGNITESETRRFQVR